MKTVSISLAMLSFLIGCMAFTTKSILIEENNIITVNKNTNMKLGAFSVSLSVKDLNNSKSFYQNLGFEVIGGGEEKNYLIMKNENALVGLFQGMFEGNIMTFNPGWDENGKNIDSAFEDVRTIQKELKSKGLGLMTEVAEGSSGPGNLMLQDPDGNIILIDQHR